VQGLKTQALTPFGQKPGVDYKGPAAFQEYIQSGGGGGGTYSQQQPTPQPQPAYSGEPSSDGGGDGGGYDPLAGLRSAFSSMRSAYEGLLPTYDADYKTFETRTNDAITRAKNTLNTQNQEDEVRYGENLRSLLQSDKELRQRRQGVFSGLNALDSSAYRDEVQEGDQFLLTRMMKLGIGEGRRAQGMSDPPSQLIGQEYQDVMG
jgi:hypothetical protein